MPRWSAPDNAEVLAWVNTDAVLGRFTVKILEDESAAGAQLTPERFKLLVNEVKAETGAKGKELFHPIRIVITGSHSGPEFDRLIPILEEGSRLKLPKPRPQRARAGRRVRQATLPQELVCAGRTLLSDAFALVFAFAFDSASNPRKTCPGLA